MAFIALGLGDGALGVAWPSVAGAFDRDLSELGVLITSLTLGYLAASALMGRLEQRFGLGPLLLTSATVMAAGYALFATANSWILVVLSQLVTGAGAALVDAGLNTHVALNHSDSTMHFLHAAFGVGATIGPILMATAIGIGAGWRAGYLVLAGAQVVLVLGFARAREWPKAPPADAPGSGNPPTMLLPLTVFLFYTGVEVAAGQWSYTVLTEERAVSEAVAGGLIAGYWGVLTLGRLGMGIISRRVGPTTSVIAGSLLAALGLLVFWIDLGPMSGGIGLLISGLGLAPVFPAMVLLTPARVGADRTAGAVGYQLAAAGLGAMVIPGGIGLLAGIGGLGVVAPALVAAAVALVVVANAATRSVSAAAR